MNSIFLIIKNLLHKIWNFIRYRVYLCKLTSPVGLALIFIPFRLTRYLGLDMYQRYAIALALAIIFLCLPAKFATGLLSSSLIQHFFVFFAIQENKYRSMEYESKINGNVRIFYIWVFLVTSLFMITSFLIVDIFFSAGIDWLSLLYIIFMMYRRLRSIFLYSQVKNFDESIYISSVLSDLLSGNRNVKDFNWAVINHNISELCLHIHQLSVKNKIDAKLSSIPLTYVGLNFMDSLKPTTFTDILFMIFLLSVGVSLFYLFR